MSKRKKHSLIPCNSPGLPGNLAAIEETFQSPQELSRALDAFLRFLNDTYGLNEPERNDPPNLLGFIVKRLRVRRDASVNDIEVQSDFAQGVATILVPLLLTESPDEWKKRQETCMEIFWPTLQDAQIRATVQLYRTLSSEAREYLEREYAKLGGATP